MHDWGCGFGVDITTVGAGEFKLQAFVNKWGPGENDMVVSQQSIMVQQWFHVAIVCSLTHLTIYLNGVKGQETTLTASVQWDDHRPLTIGYTFWHGYDFYCKGETTDYRIWSRPFTPQEIYQEIVTVVPASKDLICFLPLNIIDETKVLDLSEFRNHGSLDDQCEVTPIKCRWPPRLTTKEMPSEMVDWVRDNSLEGLENL